MITVTLSGVEILAIVADYFHDDYLLRISYKVDLQTRTGYAWLSHLEAADQEELNDAVWAAPHEPLNGPEFLQAQLDAF